MIREIQDSMVDIPDIGNTMSATTFAPVLESKRSGIGGLIARKAVADIGLNRVLEDHREEYLQSDFLDVQDGTELWRISARVGALNDVDYGEFKTDIRQPRRAGVEEVARAAGRQSSQGRQSRAS